MGFGNSDALRVQVSTQGYHCAKEPGMLAGEVELKRPTHGTVDTERQREARERQADAIKAYSHYFIPKLFVWCPVPWNPGANGSPGLC